MFIGGVATITPLLGGLFSASSTGMLLTGLVGIAALLHQIPITAGVPTMLATLSWATSRYNNNHILSIALHVILPLTCMVIFALHPVAHYAFAYTLYWLIPPCVWLARHYGYGTGIFMTALQASFVAHAIGGTIWLFIVPMTANQWLSLIPLVAVERLTFAGISALSFYLIQYSVDAVKNLRVKKPLTTP